jgi:thiamine-monophosphate kinase
VGAVVKADAIPIHPEVRAAFPQECLDFALAGGEDYELLFTASEEVIGRVRTSIERSGHGADCPITVIGEITRKGGVTVVDREGRPLAAGEQGWDHFRKGG